jgi:hypothetical protein
MGKGADRMIQDDPMEFEVFCTIHNWSPLGRSRESVWNDS